ncbi:MAG: HEPN domain-containing protein [Proteobacteria bacterium]|nr:HEPN domain-containing protein [Pseudomonadota bacterium]
MKLVQIDNWRDYRRDGEQFLKTAQGAYNKKKKTFSADTLYNLTCMAIEKLIMAYLMKNGDLAENHTMGDLLRALQLHLGMLPELADKLLYMNDFQEICDLEHFTIRIPTEADVIMFLNIGEDVRTILSPHLYDPQPQAIQ